MKYSLIFATFISCACAFGLFSNKDDASGKHPWEKHCNKLECPEYKVIKKGRGWELRRYVATEWVTVRSKDTPYKWSSSKEAFGKLFKYIGGENDQKKKINMTVPVGNLVTKDLAGYAMMFYVPPHPDSVTPTPTNKELKIVKFPAFKAYVRSYGWWATSRSMKKNLSALKKSLKKQKIPFEEGEVLAASYDSPWKVFNRHNEVMLLAKGNSLEI